MHVAVVANENLVVCRTEGLPVHIRHNRDNKARLLLRLLATNILETVMLKIYST